MSLCINKEKLKTDFKTRNYNSFFKQAYDITYNIRDPDLRADYVQDCLANLQLKINQGKIQEDNNLFSFIMANSNFRILEILRKERNRNTKVKFISYDMLDDLHNVIDFNKQEIMEEEE
jgi:DNA-directed RNA polymerase specialized sigma24 family protein